MNWLTKVYSCIKAIMSQKQTKINLIDGEIRMITTAMCNVVELYPDTKSEPCHRPRISPFSLE